MRQSFVISFYRIAPLFFFNKTSHLQLIKLGLERMNIDVPIDYVITDCMQQMLSFSLKKIAKQAFKPVLYMAFSGNQYRIGVAEPRLKNIDLQK